MRQLHLMVTDEMAKELDSFPNKSDIVREAIKMYNEGTRTDTLKSIRIVFKKLSDDMLLLDEKLNRLLARLDELSSR